MRFNPSKHFAALMFVLGCVVPAAFSATLTRGPYLQSCSTNSVVVRWRTSYPMDSRVRYQMTNQFTETSAGDNALVTEHEVRLTSLLPDTTYFYSIGSSSQTLADGTNCYFRTAPTQTRPVRVWAIGDSGDGSAKQAAVRDAYMNYPNSALTDVWLMLGDNVYEYGLDEEYQLRMFEPYAELMRHTVLSPALGNHDAIFGSPAQYTGIFTLPANGEAGGVPSHSELYYSFDYANVHFVCLDSWLSDRSSASRMCNWLRADLTATSKDWIIAYWHHPPYSMGTDYSDSTPILIQMREQVVPILESFGVDLVLCGHSHVYERSFLLNGHYSYSWTFTGSHALDARLGRPDGMGPYQKLAGGMGANRGTVYIVCGNSGTGGAIDFQRHPAMAVKHDGYGSLVLDINELRLDAKYLRESGVVDDHFTIDKSIPPDFGPPIDVTRTNNTMTISWPTASPEFTLESSTLFCTNWQPLITPRVTVGRKNVLHVGPTNASSFFRLRSQW